MKLETRQDMILSLLREEGRVTVEPLAERFGVSTQTIRADLRELDAQGLLKRTHGGARRIEAVVARTYADRRNMNSAAKEAMGRMVAGLIPNHCSITLNIGTTTEMVARALRDHLGLMVLSNNTNIIAMMMGGGAADQLIQVGGTVRQADGAIVGEDAVEFIGRYKTDFAVIGASAIDPDGAVMDYDVHEVSVARAILKNARTRILVADHTKFERTAPVRICDVRTLDYVVTDRAPPTAFQRTARNAETEILTLEDAE